MPRFVPSRVKTALRLEIARQIVRESVRYGFPVTIQQVLAVRNAERDYDLATALIRPRLP